MIKTYSLREVRNISHEKVYSLSIKNRKVTKQLLEQFKNLQYLFLYNCNWLITTNELAYWSDLKSIFFDAVQMTKTLSFTKESYTDLQELYIYNCGLKEVPSGVELLSRLTNLTLDDNLITSIPETLRSLPKLQVLSLEENQITTVPRFVESLSELQSLNLNENNLRSFELDFFNLSKLSTLYLKDNEIQDFDITRGEDSQLCNLDLSGNQLQEIPDCLKYLQHLQVLFIGHNPLKKFVMDNIPSGTLNKLRLDNLGISDFPAEHSIFKNLRELDLSFNELPTFSFNPSLFPTIETLSLEHNQFSSTEKKQLMDFAKTYNIERVRL